MKIEFTVAQEQPESTRFTDEQIISDVSYPPYIHQQQGIELIAKGESILCTVGTGGGKRDIFQLGMINWLNQQEVTKSPFFYSLYPTYALLRQHHELLRTRFDNLLLNKGVGEITGKVRNLMRELGREVKSIKEGDTLDEEPTWLIPTMGLVGTIDKWAYLHYPSKKNKRYKAEFFYRQLYAPKIFDEVHILHPLALQHTTLNLTREGLILDKLEGKRPELPHSFFSATAPEYLKDVLLTRGLITHIVKGRGRHTKLNITIHPPEEFEEHSKLIRKLIEEGLNLYDKIIVILNSRRRAYALANTFDRKKRPYSLFRVFNGWNEYRAIAKAPKPKVLVIATSSAEVGVSDNFQLLITESAPATNLIQRIGRVGRYGDNSAEVHILPAPGRGNQWYTELLKTDIETTKEFSGIEELREVLQNVDTQVPGSIFPNTNSELIFALHYYLNTLWEERTLLTLDLNERMFDGSKYSSEADIPDVRTAKYLYEQHSEFIRRLVLQGMTLRTSVPNIYYKESRFSDNPVFALKTLSTKLIITENAYIEGFYEPSPSPFSLGVVPLEYGKAIYLPRSDYNITAMFAVDGQASDIWKDFCEKYNIGGRRGYLKLQNSPLLQYVRLRFGEIRFYVSTRTSAKVPIVYDGIDSNSRFISFQSFGIIFRLMWGKTIDDLEAFLSKFPDSMFIQLLPKDNNMIIGIENSFGAAISLFKSIEEELKNG